MDKNTRETVSLTFEPHFDAILDAIKRGIEFFSANSITLNARLCKSTRAYAVNDCIREELSHFAAKTPGFDCRTEHKGFLLTYNGYALRPKKVDDNFRSSNIPTQRVNDILSQDYFSQEWAQPIQYQYLTLGYQLTDINTLDGLFIVMEGEKHSVSWVIPIDKSAAYTESMFTLPDLPEQEPEKRVHVKPAATGKKKKSV